MHKPPSLAYSEDAVTIAIDRQLGNCWLKKGQRNILGVNEDFDIYDAEMEATYDPSAIIDSAIDQKYHFQEWYMDRYLNSHNGNNGGPKCIPLKTSGKQGLIRR